jgi:hypothetical protein
MVRKNSLTSLGLLFVFIALAIMSLTGISYAIFALGLLVIYVSSWVLMYSPRVWRDYKVSYNKLPKKKRNIFNEPKQIYYVINRYIFMPFGFALGSLLIYLSWLIK